MQEILSPKRQFFLTGVARATLSPSHSPPPERCRVARARLPAGEARPKTPRLARSLPPKFGAPDAREVRQRASPQGLRAGHGAFRRAARRGEEPLPADQDFRQRGQ